MYTPLRDDTSHRSLSKNERTFLLNCATGQTVITSPPPSSDTTTTTQPQPNPSILRTDGRSPSESRPIQLTFGRSHNISECDVRYGASTRVVCVVTCCLVPPSHPLERPNEGVIRFSVDLSPMACIGFDYVVPSSTHPSAGGGGGGGGAGGGSGAMGEETQRQLSNRILRILERTLVSGGAMDAESLCVQSGKWVWRLQVGVTALDHGGNLVDASVLAAVAALRHFRVPQVSLDGTAGEGEGGGGEGGGDDSLQEHPVVIHSDEREPTPLPLHHTPVSSTFALYRHDHTDSSSPSPIANNPSSSSTTPTTSNSVSALIDPTNREELVMDGTLTFSFNRYGEMCSLDFPGGCELHPRQLRKCAELGRDRCKELCGILEEALGEADGKAGRDRLERLRVVRERAGEGAGIHKSESDNRHLLPNIPETGVPYVHTQTQYDHPNNPKSNAEILQIPTNDEQSSAKTAAAIAAAEEESYRIQALDYSLGHVAARAKENSSGGGGGGRGNAGGGGGGGGGGGSGRPMHGSSLMAAMLKSASSRDDNRDGATNHNNNNNNNRNDNSTTTTTTTTAINAISSSSRTREADEEFARFAAAETAKVSLPPPPSTPTVPRPPPPSSSSTVIVEEEEEGGVLDSDEEETTTTLRNEFNGGGGGVVGGGVAGGGGDDAVSMATEVKKKPSGGKMEVDDFNSKMDDGDVVMKDSASPGASPVGGVVETKKVVATEDGDGDGDGDDDDDDDLASAVKKKKKKSKKGSKKNRR